MKYKMLILKKQFNSFHFPRCLTVLYKHLENSSKFNIHIEKKFGKILDITPSISSSPRKSKSQIIKKEKKNRARRQLRNERRRPTEWKKKDQFSPLPLINQHRSFGVINNHLKLWKKSSICAYLWCFFYYYYYYNAMVRDKNNLKWCHYSKDGWWLRIRSAHITFTPHQHFIDTN